MQDIALGGNRIFLPRQCNQNPKRRKAKQPTFMKQFTSCGLTKRGV
jgi:hypothetical protein